MNCRLTYDNPAIDADFEQISDSDREEKTEVMFSNVLAGFTSRRKYKLLGSEGNEKRGRLDCNCFTSSQLLCSKTQAVMQVRAPYVKHCLVGVGLQGKRHQNEGENVDAWGEQQLKLDGWGVRE